jgi:D-inositol-3-phosphate glycosyltransferase
MLPVAARKSGGSMRKIALISDHASPLALLGGTDSGGQNVYVAHLARQLARRGCHVDVFTRRDSPCQPPINAWRNNIRVIHVPAGPPAFVPKEELLPCMKEFTAYLINFFRMHRTPYDVIHANFFMSGLVGLEAARALGVPLVVTFHALGKIRRQFQGDADRFPVERLSIEEEIIRDADRILAECPQDEEDMRVLYQADPGKIDVAPCGYDPAEFNPVEKTLARAHLGWPQDEFIVLQLGRMVPRKGVDNAIRGVAAARKRHRVKARLYIVGGESDTPSIEATPEIGRLAGIAREEGVDDAVGFVGRRGRSALRLYYSAADVFVTTPWYEPFGITPLEAMACRVPVIGSAVGGIKYSVIDSQTGYLVPPNDPDALADRLAQLHGSPQLRNALGNNALARAAEFTWDRVCDGVVQCYERAAQARPPRAPMQAAQA